MTYLLLVSFVLFFYNQFNLICQLEHLAIIVDQQCMYCASDLCQWPSFILSLLFFFSLYRSPSLFCIVIFIFFVCLLLFFIDFLPDYSNDTSHKSIKLIKKLIFSARHTRTCTPVNQVRLHIIQMTIFMFPFHFQYMSIVNCL